MASTKELKQIIKLATGRRATLIKRLDAERAKEQHDRASQVKCDQIMMRLQGENEIIGDCQRLLRLAEDQAFLAKFKEAA